MNLVFVDQEKNTSVVVELYKKTRYTTNTQTTKAVIDI